MSKERSPTKPPATKEPLNKTLIRKNSSVGPNKSAMSFLNEIIKKMGLYNVTKLQEGKRTKIKLD